MAQEVPSRLSHLEVLTKELPSIPEAEEGPDDAVFYPIVGGRARSIGLLKEKGCAVAWTTHPAGGEWKMHAHEMVEMVAIWSGSGTFTIDGVDREVGPGDFVVIDPHTPHSFRSDEEVEMIAITIPADERWPDARRGGQSQGG